MEKINTNRVLVFALAGFFIAANAFAIYFISQERYLYLWDFLNYWKKYVYLTTHFLEAPLDTIKTVVYSIREDNYNFLAACFLMPFGLLFGTSRLAYILSILNIYALAAVILFVALHKKLSERKEYETVFLPLIPVGTILLSPNFWEPILRGFPDVGGIVLINFILLLYLNNPLSKQRTRDLLLIAVLIPILVLFRRWYAYWGISFYLVLFMEIGLTALLARPFNVKDLVKILSRFLAQVSVSALFFFTVAPTFAQRILKTDYSDMNSAYRYSENLFQSFEVVLKKFGLLYFCLFLLGAISAMIDKRTRKFAIFAVVQWVIIFVLFARTQDFDSHQCYLLLPPVLLFSSLFISRVVSKMKSFKVLVLGSLAVLFVLNFFTAFGAQATGGSRTAHPALFTSIRHMPYVRNDFNEIERIFLVLEELMTDPLDRVYILSSSDVLNSDAMSAAYLTLGRYKEIGKKILVTHNSDKRDGFPQGLLTANYVMAADPIQYSIGAKDQRVVGIPAELFLKQEGIATSFQKLPYEFNLRKNVKVYIYQKRKPILEQDAAALSESLRRYYPDRENIYQIKGK